MIGSVSAAELGGFTLLRGLPEGDRSLLAASAERRELPDGAILYAEGTPTTELYLVEHGHITLRIMRDGRPVIVGLVGPDEPLAWSSFREEPLALTTARASGPVQLVAIRSERMLDLMCSGTPSGRTLLQRIIDTAALNLAATREQMIRHGREGVITAG
jgi:CRP-like cAMP-binding protein